MPNVVITSRKVRLNSLCGLEDPIETWVEWIGGRIRINIGCEQAKMNRQFSFKNSLDAIDAGDHYSRCRGYAAAIGIVKLAGCDDGKRVSSQHAPI